MLSPNGLKVLDALGVYERIRVKGYNFETLEYKDGSGKLHEIYEYGGKEKFGYASLRIYRHILVTELLAILKEQNLPVVFGKKFMKVISETETEVTWEFQDGTTESADILIGADGIHSTVRSYLYPDLKPVFAGMAAIIAAVPTKQLNLPAGYHVPVTIMTPLGAFVIAPQDVDGSEVLIGRQKCISENPDRAGWDRIHGDKEGLAKFLQQDAEQFPEFVQNAVSDIPHGRINVWPFYTVPRLETWASEQRRVIILGDAAHGIPPSAGQGINQAFEDVYIFAQLLSQADKVDMQEALSFWQDYRQQRIEKVISLNNQIQLRRMSKEEQDGMPARSMEEIELSWLYKPNLKDEVDRWVAARKEKRV